MTANAPLPKVARGRDEFDAHLLVIGSAEQSHPPFVSAICRELVEVIHWQARSDHPLAAAHVQPAMRGTLSLDDDIDEAQ